jgi:hypothetical protein
MFSSKDPRRIILQENEVSILAYQEDNFLEEKKGRLQSPSSLLVWL